MDEKEFLGKKMRSCGVRFFLGTPDGYPVRDGKPIPLEDFLQTEVTIEAETEHTLDLRELSDPDPDLEDFVDEKTQENDLAHGLG